MRIIYPYNEILPKRSAHDVFIFDSCAALATQGMDVSLLCGKGSASDLFDHYAVPPHCFSIQRLPIVRKNNLFNISWNTPFFFCVQRQIRRIRPDWVIMSVPKQAAYHLARKISHVRYLYEVHQLAYYPDMETLPSTFHVEQQLLQRADLITVTTQALKKILLAPPYSIQIPIEVVPLAVKKEPLPPPESGEPLTLMYIGQLYAGQGLPHLLEAVSQVEGVQLKVVGGKQDEIAHLKKRHAQVEFLGYIPPGEVCAVAQQADAFVAPFEPTGRMPYVAHTKLFEYARMGRPFIAPKMPVVEEHFTNGEGVLLYEPGNTEDLVKKMRLLKDAKTREHLQKQILNYKTAFSWEARATRYSELLNTK